MIRGDNMENMTQFQRDFIRMLDSMRDISKGAISCIGIDADKCEKCLLADICDNEILYNAEKVIEIVTQWAKEHSFVTYEQKYEETFGVKPKDKCGDYACPRCVGFLNCECRSDHDCERCKSEFWNSEYKPPKKEGVTI